MQLRESLRSVSRTFAISIEYLPSDLRNAVTIAYLLFRVSDCLEDHTELDWRFKADLLRLWADILKGDASVTSLISAIAYLDDSDPEIAVAQHANQLLVELNRLPESIRETIINHVYQTSLGMARWQEQGPIINTEDELDDYMHEVAGRVGYLITDLFAWHSSIIRERLSLLRPLARQSGLALQTVNVIRGLRKDYERGWVFVPRTFYEPLGLTHDTLFAKENTGAALQVIGRLADKAESHLQQGLKYVLHIPRMHYRIRLACTWPLFFAIKTLAVSRNNIHVILSEAKITRSEVMQIIRQTTLMGWSDNWLHSYYSRILTV